MARQHRRTAFVALIVASALSLSACGGDDEATDSSASPSAEPTENETTETETEEPETEPAETEDGPVDADLTPAGTELTIGDSAVVPVSYSDGEGVVELTVTEIRKGDTADLEGVEDAEDYVPYYVSYEVTGVSGTENLSYWGPSSDLDALQTDGTPAGILITTQALDGCASESAPDAWAGEAFSGCFPALALKSSEIASVQYALSDSDYDQYDGQPVVWQ